MNALGLTYLATKRHVNLISPSRMKTSQKEVLTERFLAEWHAYNEISPDTILADTLQYSSENIPFYRTYFAQNPDKNAKVLADWPVLTRDHLWNDADALKATSPSGWKTWTHASGGSTGKPVVVLHDEYFAAKAQALRMLCSEIFFGGPYYNKLILWGMSDEVERQIPTGLKDKALDQIKVLMGIKTSHVNTFEFTEHKFKQCVGIISHQKPQFIFGYAGSVYELAKYMDDRSIRPSRPPNIVGTTAQTLYPFMRECIEKVFQCRVCDHYGSREVGPVAWQHPDGDMYFPKFFSRIEVVDADGRAVPEGEPGKILVTNLHNRSMPLIRYDIGDTGILGEDAYYHGYPFSTLKEIKGRSSDEFITKRGSRVCAPFFINLFYYRSWLDQFHIVQRDYDYIEIMYIPKPPQSQIPDDERQEIDERIRKVMTAQCRIVWTKVDKMPTTKAGKRLFIRSEVQPQRFRIVQ
jgi:phenylacetate-CoA ligase